MIPTMIQKSLTIAALAAWCVAGAVVAAPQQELDSGVVVDHGRETLVLDTPEGRETFALDADTIQPGGLDTGDLVVVRSTEPGSPLAEEVIMVEDRIEVLGEIDDQERAVFGTVSATSPQQLLVETPTGGQAFVIDPEKLFPPLPAPDQRLVVTYRTLEIHPPLHMATGLVALPDDFQFAYGGSVRETSEPMQVAQVAPPPPPRSPEPIRQPPAPEPVVAAPVAPRMESLPQTATPVPLALAAGVLLVGLGVASRFSR